MDMSGCVWMCVDMTLVCVGVGRHDGGVCGCWLRCTDMGLCQHEWLCVFVCGHEDGVYGCWWT